MTPRDVIDYFGGTQMSASNALGISQSVISDWSRSGRIPFTRQVWIEELSGGALRADRDAWRNEIPQARSIA